MGRTTVKTFLIPEVIQDFPPFTSPFSTTSPAILIYYELLQVANVAYVRVISSYEWAPKLKVINRRAADLKDLCTTFLTWQDSENFMLKNHFVMVDGLDGSGKGAVVDALQRWAELKGMKVLDLRSYCREKNTFPEPEEIIRYDAVVSAEPTFCYVGRAIREELLRATDRPYSAISLAHAFALDREILYKSVLIPAIKAGKYVFQERGISSSLVYQPVQEHIQLSELIRLSGNRTA